MNEKNDIKKLPISVLTFATATMKSEKIMKE